MRKAIICGAGVAGLSAAIALAKNGWLVEVYERDSAVREIGAGIFVKANALRVIANFGLLDRIRRDCVILREARSLDKCGKVLQQRVLESNPVWNIQRQLLIRALFDRATELGAEVNTDSAVTDVSTDGTVHIDGRRLRAEFVVGADGVSSVTRSALGLDSPVRMSASGAIRLLVRRTSTEAEDVVREFWSGPLRVGVAPCTKSEAFTYLIAPLSDERGTRVPIDLEYWSASFPRLASEGLFERAQITPAVHHRYPFVSTLAWSKGCAALVGDAAHALPPTLGQGAGLSLTNTLLLAHYVSSRPDLREGLIAWERDWRWVSDRTQRWATRYDWITSEWPSSLYGLREALIWGIGKSRRLNSYMRVADRVDAPQRLVLPVAGNERSHTK